MLGQDFENMVRLFAKLPGVGSRSARRIMLHLLAHKDDIMLPLSNALQDMAEHIQNCETCHTLDTTSPCQICGNMARDHNLICVVETVADLWALERTAAYNGLYHVLGGTLSALDGVTPEDLHIPHLITRIDNNADTDEVIIALNATVDGQTTAHYITERLKAYDIKITRLARGVPMGSALDYLDDNTLVTAMTSRSNL